MKLTILVSVFLSAMTFSAIGKEDRPMLDWRNSLRDKKYSMPDIIHKDRNNVDKVYESCTDEVEQTNKS